MPELATHSHSSFDPLSSSAKNPKCPEAPFLSDDEQERIEYIQNYEYYCDLPSGYVRIRMMKPEEVGCVAELLAYAHGEGSRPLAENYAATLIPSMKEYLMKKGSDLPRCVIMVAFYRDKGETKGEEQLVGTIKINFYDSSSEFCIPAPEGSPYGSNMAVKGSLRRLGIGWHLLKVVEETTCKLRPFKDGYFHVATNGPLSLYERAGLVVVKSDNNVHLLCRKWKASKL